MRPQTCLSSVLIVLALNGCTATNREISSVRRVMDLPLNKYGTDCYLLPPTGSSEGPYMLIRFSGAFFDLTRAVLTCLNDKGRAVSVVRECESDKRLKYGAANGYFSNPIAGDPAKEGGGQYTDYQTWHLGFQGDEHFDVHIPFVRLVFWCESAEGQVSDAKDPYWYEPDQQPVG